MFFLQLDEMLDLVKYEHAELHRQAALDALAVSPRSLVSSIVRLVFRMRPS